ncbi:hypothetical protein MF406_14260 [Georgenia sp. TF02-10]|uniref:hypothetical protein n=1 Tax=Georgenia sp. TF02-10 TaxID=2917725 RepID=UPI001FA6F70F|nr:hypothetical protein [Georgenia sp. TF02-10]UNX54095.1 hypothetical protein MF406_14260 [Georgenia sp. TF02-10]
MTWGDLLGIMICVVTVCGAVVIFEEHPDNPVVHFLAASWYRVRDAVAGLLRVP